ncbi:M48 family metalloprotease [Aliivibrio sifiae]|uniref:M48 family metalloprotease n=1 Tax=Aliivibrio sifiae TaxID=566293 RepID=UPI003D107EB3
MNKTHALIKISGSALLAFSLSGCSVSPNYDKSVGEKNSLVIEQQMGLYNNESLDQYVKQVGARLVSNLESPQFDFKFEVVDDPVPNAFALPGGYIYISRGLLNLMNNEDELACVLAHEIIHVTERHSIQQMKRSILPGITQLPGNIVGSVINEDLGNLINTPFAFSSSLLMANYSRSHETESDDLGVELAAKSGYDPMAMGVILTRLNNAVEFETQKETEKSYFDSHPYTPERVSHVNQSASTLNIASKPPIHSDFLSYLNGLVVGDNPESGTFNDGLFLQPTMGFTITFPKEWQTVNQPQVVAAINDTQDGFVALSVTEPKYTAEQTAHRFSQYLEQKYNYAAQVNTVDLPWGASMYNVQLVDDSADKKAFINQYWLDFNDVTYQILTLNTDNNKDEITSSATSLQPITNQQIATITQQEIKIITARNGENLNTLTKRNDSQLSTEGVAVWNGLKENTPLQKDQKVKIVVTQPYKK